MTEKIYFTNSRASFFRKLAETVREVKQAYIIKKIEFDATTKQFKIVVDASDSFHNVLSSKL